MLADGAGDVMIDDILFFLCRNCYRWMLKYVARKSIDPAPSTFLIESQQRNFWQDLAPDIRRTGRSCA